ncbi:MAG: hypothetical protein ACREHG_01900, partial [Candidatus Saccharimonadales bacterium]
MPVQSSGGHRYWCLFVDDSTKFWGLYFLRTKDQTFEAFKVFKAAMELETGHKIKALQDDKGGEYMSKEMEQYLEDCGIQRRHTMRNEPHSNGIAERANGTITNRATSLLHESKLPPSFWKHAVATVCHTHNRMPTSPLPNSTPYESLYGKKPDVSLFRVFGSLAYVHIQKDKRTGLSPHMEKAIFVGYPAQYKGWEFYNPATHKFILSDRADFDENSVLAPQVIFLIKFLSHWLLLLLILWHMMIFTFQMCLIRWEMCHLRWEMISHRTLALEVLHLHLLLLSQGDLEELG